ncbi:histidinol dehydrogenase [Desulfofundulus thermobenzoicus]|uniref:Histidinol dehydrogenase n=1 Tax=Desulfofundulus thermobenzoicus TaxID=29376 RepID=A0A6N7IQH7_9FIRM|nr:histidinol dehydrogenase [Desulfofundulus thermobenzoicus]MQL52282.1 histidinol dehydrogenase [Desulfofundulus thermobenzoicus]
MLILKEARGNGQQKDGVGEVVASILDHVKQEGDRALFDLTRRYDGVELTGLRVQREEIDRAYGLVERETIKHLQFAAAQIRNFALHQLNCLQDMQINPMPGVVLGHRLVPVSSCGAYVPAGRYPLPSSALMSIIPAKVAGVKRIAACSPPNKEYGGIHPAVLVAMDMAGADEIYCMGGAQAIGAFAYGTGTVPRVDLIVGPGNRYVTEAKKQLTGMVGIDLLAGPSEVLIIADETATPRYVAVDLLAKCEHDPASIAILVTTSRALAEAVQDYIAAELENLETAPLARKTWAENGQIILAKTLEEAVEIANSIAPEHLQLQTKCNEDLVEKLHNYGSLFIGHYAPVAFGDYVSGPNHILPTMGCARFAGGVWVGTFIKVLSYQKVNKEGAAALANTCSYLAGLEGLAAHRRSADIRK